LEYSSLIKFNRK